MVDGHRIERKIEVTNFLDLMKNYNYSNIECSKHTVFRLSEKQSKSFKCSNLIELLLTKEPKLVGIQYNGLHAVFYKNQNNNYIKILLDISLKKIEIVTYYTIDLSQLPVIK